MADLGTVFQRQYELSAEIMFIWETIYENMNMKVKPSKPTNMNWKIILILSTVVNCFKGSIEDIEGIKLT